MHHKILHIVTELRPEGGEVSEFAAQLAKAQKTDNDDVVIAAIAGENLAVTAFEAEELGVRIGRFAPTGSSPYHFSRDMLHNLRKIVKGADIVHVHGTGSFPVWWGSLLAIIEKKRLIYSPHGGCSSDSTHTKKKFSSAIDRFFIKRATLVHAVSESEKETIAAHVRGITDKVTVVPPGVELPRLIPKTQSHDTRTFLYIGDISASQGLDMLIDALAKCDARKAFKLIVCSPATDEDISPFKAQAEKLGIQDKIEFREHVTGMSKWRTYREADCLILPTRGEPFGTTVLEALACGVPVICTKCAPWEILATEHCGWWCDASADGLAIAIRDMLYHYDQELTEMGNNGKKLALEHFTWKATADRLSI